MVIIFSHFNSKAIVLVPHNLTEIPSDSIGLLYFSTITQHFGELLAIRIILNTTFGRGCMALWVWDWEDHMLQTDRLVPYIVLIND